MTKSIAFLLVVVFATTAASQTKTKTKRVEGQQKLVEEAADRVMRRFYETLDFGTVYRELFVSNPLKAREVRISVGYVFHFGMPPGKLNEAAIRNIDFASMERAYLAGKQWSFLVSALKFTYDKENEIFREDLEASLKQHYMPMMASENWPVATSQDLNDRFTSNYERLNSVWRRYVNPGNYQTDLYRSRVASFRESKQPVSRIKDIFSPRQKIYVAQREEHHLYFVKEGGVFKMLTVTSRVMD